MHGDVSAANVLFTAGGVPLLADLGVARLTGDVRPTPRAPPPTSTRRSPPAACPVRRATCSCSAAVALHALTGVPPGRARIAASDAARRARAGRSTTSPAGWPRPVLAGDGRGAVPGAAVDPHRRGTAADLALDLRYSGGRSPSSCCRPGVANRSARAAARGRAGPAHPRRRGPRDPAWPDSARARCPAAGRPRVDDPARAPGRRPGCSAAPPGRSIPRPRRPPVARCCARRSRHGAAARGGRDRLVAEPRSEVETATRPGRPGHGRRHAARRVHAVAGDPAGPGPRRSYGSTATAQAAFATRDARPLAGSTRPGRCCAPTPPCSPGSSRSAVAWSASTPASPRCRRARGRRASHRAR